MRSVSVLAVVMFVTCLCLAAVPLLAQGKRVALIIGNSEYTSAPKLENPKNDAADMAVTLAGLGFQVLKGIDLDKVATDRIIRDFAEALSGARVGLLFYAGHGIQVAGQNYLVPVDATLTTGAALDFEMVRLDLVQRVMERETKTNLIILDACRDNPLARNLARALGTRSTAVGKGLAGIESGEGTLISFSTQPGNVALDGTGRNSPFATALLKHIVTPGDDLPTILINVRNDVMAQTERRQVPWEHSALTARFFFTEPKASADQEVELSLWASVKDSTDPTVVNTYMRKYPQGTFAVVARTLIAALEAQQQMERAALEDGRKREAELRKAQEDVRKAQKDAEALSTAKMAALPKGAPVLTDQHPFDGTWRVEFRGGAGCLVRSNVASWVISKSALPNRGKGAGKVTHSGTLSWKLPGAARSDIIVSYSATLKANRGSGSYQGGTCAGTITLSRQ